MDAVIIPEPRGCLRACGRWLMMDVMEPHDDQSAAGRMAIAIGDAIVSVVGRVPATQQVAVDD